MAATSETIHGGLNTIAWGYFEVGAALLAVVIEPGASLIHARMRAALAELDQGDFTEAHELDRKWQVPQAMIGRRLSQEEAKMLLVKRRRLVVSEQSR